MATEATRTDFGMTSKGQVVVIEKQSYDDAGSSLVSNFEVRHGVRTIGAFDSYRKASAVASAIARENKDS